MYSFRLVLIIFLALALRLILSVNIYSGDVNNHVAWSKSILTDGAYGAYDRKYVGVMSPTYPPLALYSFSTAHLLYDFIYKSAWNLNSSIPFFPSGFIWWMQNQNILPAFHKIISIFSDIGIGVLIYLLARVIFKVKSPDALWGLIFYLFNPAVFYNSTLWGQLEAIPVFFILLGIWFVLKHKTLLGHASFVSALMFKQSSLIFAPVFLIFSVIKSGWKKTLAGLLVEFAIFFAVYLPFTSNPILVYINKFQTGSGSDYTTDHAFNFWALFTHLDKISDNKMFIWGASTSLFGSLIFIILAGLILIRYILSRKNEIMIHSLGLLSFISFMVLTRMHERYLGPALAFLCLAATKNKGLRPIYFLVSLGHVINLYHLWWYPDVPVLKTLISSWNTILAVIIIFTLSLISWMAVFFNSSKHETSWD